MLRFNLHYFAALLLLAGCCLAGRNVIDEMLWDPKVLKELRVQVEGGQQTDPYALRYFEWLKQREKHEEKKRKKLNEQKQAQQPDQHASLQKATVSKHRLEQQAKQIQEAIMEQLMGDSKLLEPGKQRTVVVTIPDGFLDTNVVSDRNDDATQNSKNRIKHGSKL
jgi:putative protein kinase ArgK-like GTPase of G3E family